MARVKRSLLAHFLNTGTKTTPVWSRIGQGVSEMSVDYNPEVTTEQWIHEDAPRNAIERYAPSSGVSAIAYSDDPVFIFIDNLRKTRAIGTDAECQMLNVDIYDVDGSNYWAELQPVTIQIDNIGGETSTEIGFTITYNGSPDVGTATITDGVPSFTKTQ